MMGHYDDSYAHTAEQDRKKQDRKKQDQTNKAVWKRIDKLTDKIREEMNEADLSEHDDQYVHALHKLVEFEIWTKHILRV